MTKITSSGGQQVDDENQRLAGEAVPAPGSAVGRLGRNRQLTSTADLHPGDTVLPALDQTAQWKLDRFAAIPRAVEFLARVVLDADVVHLNGSARHSLRPIADHQILDDKLGRRGSFG